MVTVRIPDDLRERIDVARGDVPRERWIRRALGDGMTETERVQRLIATAHDVVARYYKEHPDGPLASLIGDLDIAATTAEMWLLESSPSSGVKRSTGQRHA